MFCGKKLETEAEALPSKGAKAECHTEKPPCPQSCNLFPALLRVAEIQAFIFQRAQFRRESGKASLSK